MQKCRIFFCSTVYIFLHCFCCTLRNICQIVLFFIDSSCIIQCRFVRLISDQFTNIHSERKWEVWVNFFSWWNCDSKITKYDNFLPESNCLELIGSKITFYTFSWDTWNLRIPMICKNHVQYYLSRISSKKVKVGGSRLLTWLAR